MSISVILPDGVERSKQGRRAKGLTVQLGRALLGIDS